MEGINYPQEQTELAQSPAGDEQAIQAAIEIAQAEEREVDDAVARAIAAQLHGGQGSALYRFASTGDLTDERLPNELRQLYQDRNPLVLDWASVLGTYALHREHRGPVDGWASLWPTAPRDAATPGDEAAARAALMERISAAAVTTLGQVAAIHTIGDSADVDNEDSVDDLPWGDAARWRPTDPELDKLDYLFTRQPDVELGTTTDMGRLALVRHTDRPGGVVLHENHYGRRWAWTTDSNDALVQRWKEDQRQYDAFQIATASGGSPSIWVGSLSDYVAGHLHGEWLDASHDADVLEDAVRFLLQNSHDPTAEEYAVMDYDGFSHELTAMLGEYPDLQTISRLAHGIAEHGGAYGAWATYVGPSSSEAIDQFEDHYLGEWDTLRDYADHLLDEMEADRYIEEAPEWLRPYISLDIDGYAHDLGFDLHVVDAPGGRVWVFDARA
jgi:antirestriction protein